MSYATAATNIPKKYPEFAVQRYLKFEIHGERRPPYRSTFSVDLALTFRPEDGFWFGALWAGLYLHMKEQFLIGTCDITGLAEAFWSWDGNPDTADVVLGPWKLKTDLKSWHSPTALKQKETE